MKTINRLFFLLCALALIAFPAAAETVSFTGQVTASYTHEVYSPYTAVVEKIHVSAGDTVTADTPVVQLRTNKVYAEADGVVTAVFAREGDSAEALTARYGAAIFLDDGVHYTIDVPADDTHAYNSVESQYVQPGEAVCLRSRSEESRTGTGVITAVTDAGYTVEVLTGSFLAGETVNIYRTADYAESQRIGRGAIATRAPLAVTATGNIVRLAVHKGDTVRRGDLLMETLSGGAAASADRALLPAGADGAVAAVSASQGAPAEAGTPLISIWPWDAMQLQAVIPEADLGAIAVGDKVEIVFDWNQDTQESCQGTVNSIAAVNDAAGTGTQYFAYIDFTPDAAVRFGMNATVTTIE